MKRLSVIILTLILILINTAVFAGVKKGVNAQNKTTKKEFVISASDGFVIKGNLEYFKIKNKREYSTVVLLHSLGYTSDWWEELPQDLLNQGFAVLTIDLRGHGKSVYNSKLTRTSWKSLTDSAYAKYPEDVARFIEHVKKDNTKVAFFDNWAIVGADIGGSTAIRAAEMLPYRPKTIVLMSPVVKTKGIYIPVRLAHLDNVDIFSITGTGETSAQNAEKYLKKFAQATFITYVSQARSSGMLLLKHDNDLSKIITDWIKEYLT